MMHKLACCHDEVASHRLSISAAFWIILIVYTELECSSLKQNLMEICCSTQSVILNVMVTQYTCSLKGIYLHWLVQWSCHCSHVHIPVHSPWLPGYIDDAQIVLFILTMAGFFSGQALCVCWIRVFMFEPVSSSRSAIFFQLYKDIIDITHGVSLKCIMCWCDTFVHLTLNKLWVRGTDPAQSKICV